MNNIYWLLLVSLDIYNVRFFVVEWSIVIGLLPIKNCLFLFFWRRYDEFCSILDLNDNIKIIATPKYRLLTYIGREI